LSIHFNQSLCGCDCSFLLNDYKGERQIKVPQTGSGSVAMDLETVLASSCRRRILKALWKLGRASVMELVRKVNSTYSQVNPNLQILEKEGIIVDEHFGRMRIIRLNKENTKTLLLLQALRTLNTQMATNRKQPDEKETACNR